jgi:hypothetical protein
VSRGRGSCRPSVSCCGRSLTAVRWADPIIGCMPVLICERVRFYSAEDETAFFGWIGRIVCVSHVEGRGDQILLHLPTKRVSALGLRELIGLFARYNVDMRQLAQFETSQNREWFRNSSTLWHKRVFGSAGGRPATRRTKSIRHD